MKLFGNQIAQSTHIQFPFRILDGFVFLLNLGRMTLKKVPIRRETGFNDELKRRAFTIQRQNFFCCQFSVFFALLLIFLESGLNRVQSEFEIERSACTSFSASDMAFQSLIFPDAFACFLCQSW